MSGVLNYERFLPAGCTHVLFCELHGNPSARLHFGATFVKGRFDLVCRYSPAHLGEHRELVHRRTKRYVFISHLLHELSDTWLKKCQSFRYPDLSSLAFLAFPVYPCYCESLKWVRHA